MLTSVTTNSGLTTSLDNMGLLIIRIVDRSRKNVNEKNAPLARKHDFTPAVNTRLIYTADKSGH